MPALDKVKPSAQKKGRREQSYCAHGKHRTSEAADPSPWPAPSAREPGSSFLARSYTLFFKQDGERIHSPAVKARPVRG